MSAIWSFPKSKRMNKNRRLRGWGASPNKPRAFSMRRLDLLSRPAAVHNRVVIHERMRVPRAFHKFPRSHSQWRVDQRIQKNSSSLISRSNSPMMKINQYRPKLTSRIHRATLVEVPPHHRQVKLLKALLTWAAAVARTLWASMMKKMWSILDQCSSSIEAFSEACHWRFHYKDCLSMQWTPAKPNFHFCSASSTSRSSLPISSDYSTLSDSHWAKSLKSSSKSTKSISRHLLNVARSVNKLGKSLASKERTFPAINYSLSIC